MCCVAPTQGHLVRSYGPVVDKPLIGGDCAVARDTGQERPGELRNWADLVLCLCCQR